VKTEEEGEEEETKEEESKAASDPVSVAESMEALKAALAEDGDDGD
jgi:hypothetical protein